MSSLCPLTRILFSRFRAMGFSAVHKPTRWRLSCLRVINRDQPCITVWSVGLSWTDLLVSIRWSALMVNIEVCRCLGRAPSLRASSCILEAISLSPSWQRHTLGSDTERTAQTRRRNRTHLDDGLHDQTRAFDDRHRRMLRERDQTHCCSKQEFIRDALNWSVTVKTFIMLQKIYISNKCCSFELSRALETRTESSHKNLI